MDYDCYFLKVTKYLMVTAGTWPQPKTRNSYLSYIYIIYSTVIQTYFLIFLASISVEYFIVMNTLDKSRRANILTFELEYWLTIWKVWVLKKPSILNLMYKIVELEKNLKEKKDREMEEIYRSYSLYNFKIGLILPIVTASCATLMSFVFIDTYVVLKNANVLLLPEKVINQKKNYDFYYWNQNFCGCVGALYIVCVDSLIVSLIIFAIVRIKLLGKQLDRLFRDENVSKDDNMKQLRALIVEHKDIISHVEDLNKKFRLLYFVDFSIKSYQLCLSMFNIFEVTGVPIMWFMFNISESFVIMIQVVVMYSQANEVTVESEELATVIYQTHWYGQPSEVTKCLIIMMLRAQRALKLESYGIVTLSSELLQKVIKAGYTYIVLSLNNKSRAV